MTVLEIMTAIAEGVSEIDAIQEQAQACKEHLKGLLKKLAECEEGEEP